eukprot:14183793-Alexandrium_andersonii.AAC.1
MSASLVGSEMCIRDSPTESSEQLRRARGSCRASFASSRELRGAEGNLLGAPGSLRRASIRYALVVVRLGSRVPLAKGCA